MPEMDGMKLLDWLRKYDPEVPVIMVTAMHDVSTALEAIRRGAYDYILKPFEKDQLFLERRPRPRAPPPVAGKSQLPAQPGKTGRRAHRAAAATPCSQLEQSYDETLEALGSALDLKDAETEGHCERVTAFTIAIAKAMHIPIRYLPRSCARRLPARHRQNGHSRPASCASPAR